MIVLKMSVKLLSCFKIPVKFLFVCSKSPKTIYNILNVLLKEICGQLVCGFPALSFQECLLTFTFILAFLNCTQNSREMLTFPLFLD